MSDYARFKNIEPMYKAKIKAQEDLIKALQAKIRALEAGESETKELDIFIGNHTLIFESEIVEEE